MQTILLTAVATLSLCVIGLALYAWKKKETIPEAAAAVATTVTADVQHLEAGVVTELSKAETEGKVIVGTVQSFVAAHVALIVAQAKKL